MGCGLNFSALWAGAGTWAFANLSTNAVGRGFCAYSFFTGRFSSSCSKSACIHASRGREVGRKVPHRSLEGAALHCAFEKQRETETDGKPESQRSSSIEHSLSPLQRCNLKLSLKVSHLRTISQRLFALTEECVRWRSVTTSHGLAGFRVESRNWQN